jgi:hypothetical protein
VVLTKVFYKACDVEEYTVLINKSIQIFNRVIVPTNLILILNLPVHSLER